MLYTVFVRRRLFWKKHTVKGHSMTNVVNGLPAPHPKTGTMVNTLDQCGSVRLELFHDDGSITVYGDVSKISYRLGKDWFDAQAKQMKNESGGAVSLAK